MSYQNIGFTYLLNTVSFTISIIFIFPTFQKVQAQNGQISSSDDEDENIPPQNTNTWYWKLKFTKIYEFYSSLYLLADLSWVHQYILTAFLRNYQLGTSCSLHWSMDNMLIFWMLTLYYWHCLAKATCSSQITTSFYGIFRMGSDVLRTSLVYGNSAFRCSLIFNPICCKTV